jgi:hypothetical protein
MVVQSTRKTTMPSYIVKPSRDEDFYVVWSTVVDHHTFAGTRAEVKEELEYRFEHAEDERFERADSTGTSACWEDWEDEQPYCWTSKGMVVTNVDGHPGFFWLKRQALKVWVTTGDMALLEEIVDDD